MILYEDKQYKDFNTLKSENNLVSNAEIMSICECGLCRLKQIVKKLNITPVEFWLGEGGRTYTLYHFEDVQRIKEYAAKTTQNDPIPEGYISKKELSKKLGMKYQTLSAFISRHQEFNEYSKLLFRKNTMMRFYLWNEKVSSFYYDVINSHTKQYYYVEENSISIDRESPFKTISFMCNQKQEETIRSFASASGLSLSDYILSKIFS